MRISALKIQSAAVAAVVDCAVVVADEHAVVREGLRSLVTAADGLVVVGEAAPDDVVGVVWKHRPDVLLLGVADGSAALVEDVLRAVPDVAVLVLGAREDSGAVVAAIRAGVRGYVSRSATPQEVVRAVRGVAEGWAVFGPSVATCLADVVNAPQRPFPVLTGREHEVLALMTTGRHNTAIARQLGTAPKTVCNHVSRILTKLGVPDRAAAVGLAREAGLG